MKKGTDMNKDRAELIFDKYLQGTADREERAQIESWYLEEADRAKDNAFDPLRYAAMKEEVWNKLPKPNQFKRAVLQRSWLPIAAALFVGLIGIALYSYFTFYDKATVPNEQLSFASIQPGQTKATLILANGKRIDLNEVADGEIAAQPGVQLEKMKGELLYTKNKRVDEAVYHQIQIPYGGQYQMQLADGTKVWLNAGSSLRYPVSFNAGQRIVELNGEAYFEVAKDKLHPFVVKSRGQTVEVLGTHFNVNSYSNEGVVKTTLQEGSLRILASAGSTVLKPGQQSLVKGTASIKVLQVDAADAIAWKNGRMIFKDADIQTIMREVTRWYNLEVVYKGEMPDELFTGGISRQSDLSKLLRILKLNGVQFYLDAKSGRKPLLVIEGKL